MKSNGFLSGFVDLFKTKNVRNNITDNHCSYCSNCGTKINDNIKYCPNCGSKNLEDDTK